MPPALGRRYMVAAAVPIVELSANSQTLIERAALAAAVAVGVGHPRRAARLVRCCRARSRASPAKTERIRDLDFSDRTPVESRITEIVRLSDSVERMREGLEVFGRYVSKNLVHQIMRSPETAGVGGTRREITVMFTDIEGFSRISETMEPELLTSRLSRYFDALGSAIAGQPRHDRQIHRRRHHGLLERAGARSRPRRQRLSRRPAGRRRQQRQLSEKWRSRGRPVFRTRFGLHTGLAVVGNVGAREHINYTLVGAVANQASRLEGLEQDLRHRDPGERRGRGPHGRPLRVAPRSIASWRPARPRSTKSTSRWASSTPPPQHAEFLAQWRAGRDAYGAGRFEAALACFQCRRNAAGPTTDRAGCSSSAARISCATARPTAGTAPGISTSSDGASRTNGRCSRCEPLGSSLRPRYAPACRGLHGDRLALGRHARVHRRGRGADPFHPPGHAGGLGLPGGGERTAHRRCAGQGWCAGFRRRHPRCQRRRRTDRPRRRSPGRPRRARSSSPPATIAPRCRVRIASASFVAKPYRTAELQVALGAALSD